MSSVPALVTEVLQQQLIKAFQTVEDKLDEERKELDELKFDDIEQLRERRLQEIKKMQKLKQEYKAKGHGEYTELKDQKEFFAITKKSSNVVVHFYNSFIRCSIFDGHLKILANKHLETKFCKILATSSLFLAEKINIRVIPTLILIKDGTVKDRIVGFTDLGNCDNFSTDMLEWRMAMSGVIDYEGDLLHPPEKKHMSNVKRKQHTIRGCEDDLDSGSDD